MNAHKWTQLRFIIPKFFLAPVEGRSLDDPQHPEKEKFV